jgi:hypothetical protein
MHRTLAAAICLFACLGTQDAAAAVVFRIGDTVYVDGMQYTWEEWKKLRDSAAADPQPARAVPAKSDQAAPRAASCITSIDYGQFPSDDERFDCSAGLGAMTREEMLRAGWKIDFVEKIPGARSDVFKYKLVISR